MILAGALSNGCPCCSADQFEPLIDFGALPISGLIRGDPAELLAAAPLCFQLCSSCGFVRQVRTSTRRDYRDVDRPTCGQFPAYGDDLLSRLKTIGAGPNDLLLEIGSNDGSFLERLRNAGFKRLIGVEPSSALSEQARARGHQVVNDYFGGQCARRLLEAYGPARAVICRHVLEHVPDPLTFLAAVRNCLHPDGGVALVEVPDSSVIPKRMNIQELWDEHLNYFCESSLARIIDRAGLDVLDMEVRPHLDTRNLLAWCSSKADTASSHDHRAEAEEVDLWRRLPAAWKRYREILARAVEAAPRPVYAIGASHPQCNFINYARIGHRVDYLIDDDPQKIGSFPPIAGGHPSVIPTSQFEARARAGTVLTTGFGYLGWTQRICQHAARQRMQVLDPRQFVDPSAGP